jgi:outer membrane protein OmpA-like peptidoglycan-associated protein
MRNLAVAFFLVISGATAASGQQQLPDFRDNNPRFDAAAGYNFIDANAPPGSCECFTMNGAFVSADWNLNRWLGVEGEITAGHADDISSLGQNLTLMTFAGGPRVQWMHDRFTPFGEFLLGGVRGTGSYFPDGTTSKSSASGFAYSAGGGVDIGLTRRFGIRAVDFQYLHTELPNGTDGSQNQLQVSAGVVFHFGGFGGRESGNAAAPVMQAPKLAEVQLSCNATTADVTSGEAEQIVGQSLASDHQNVSYTWTSNAGTVQGDGRVVTIDTSKLSPGTYRVDGRASLTSDSSVSSTCQVTFHVKQREVAQAPVSPSEIVVPPASHSDDFNRNVTDVFFAYNSADLSSGAEIVINQDAAYLKAHPEINVMIAGHADERGTDSYNVELGLKRAMATMNAFASAGIDRSRMQVLSYGKERPFCTERTDSCMERNRRARVLAGDAEHRSSL